LNLSSIEISTHYCIFRVSGFGNLATINVEEEYSQEITKGIVEQLNNDGFTYVSDIELDKNYDGGFHDFKKITPDYPSTWYTRYFNYL
jgi:hypothetical protein